MNSFEAFEEDWCAEPTVAEKELYGSAGRVRDERWRRLTQPRERRMVADCRKAVKAVSRDWFDAWLNASNACRRDFLEFARGKGEVWMPADVLLHAHFRIGQIACDKGLWAPAVVPDDALRPLATELKIPLGLLRDVGRELVGGELQHAMRAQSITTLLFETASVGGVVATLTLELLPEGCGDFYPAPELVFLPDREFVQAAEDARRWVREQQRLWTGDEDIRWRLERRDRQVVGTLTGPSLGGAFALAAAKLLVSD